MQDQWFRTGQGFVLVYSIADRKSLEHLSELRAKILRIQVRASSSPHATAHTTGEGLIDSSMIGLGLGADGAGGQQERSSG